MLAVGLVDKQIGLIVSISWVFQIVFALFGGVITDKMGRRLTTLIFDILSWAVPALISAVAQNFWFFLAAGIVNSLWRITQNSWTCLLAEDADPAQLVDIYTWIYIANQIVGFAAPLAGALIAAYSLVPTVRGLYFFAAVMFTIKSILTYMLTEETAQGKIRLQETRHQHVFDILKEYRHVFREIINTPQTLYTGAIFLVLTITVMISGSFWGVILTTRLKFPAQSLAVFPLIKSAVMLIFFFTVMPLINKMHFRTPLMIGCVGLVVSQLLLITSPEKNYFFVGASLLLESCCVATVSPLVDKMLVTTINAEERARIQSILFVGIILFASPFGWIAGNLSSMNKILPFVLNIILFIICGGLAFLAGRHSLSSHEAVGEIA